MVNTKDAILDSAVRIFAQKGFELASVDDIAKQAGLAKGTLYYHFESKDDLLYALIERGIDKFTDILKSDLEAGTTPRNKLEIAIETQLAFFYEYEDFCRVLLTEIWRFEIKWKKHIEQIQEKYLILIKNIIEEGIISGDFSKDLNVESATTAVFSLISFASLDWAIFHPKKSQTEMLSTIKTIFFNGLANNN